jgi:hypothetical protein
LADSFAVGRRQKGELGCFNITQRHLRSEPSFT